MQRLRYSTSTFLHILAALLSVSITGLFIPAQASFLECVKRRFTKSTVEDRLNFEGFWKAVIGKYPEYAQYKATLEQFPWQSLQTSALKWMGSNYRNRDDVFSLIGNTPFGKIMVQFGGGHEHFELAGWKEGDVRKLEYHGLEADYLRRQKSNPETWKAYVYPRYDRKSPRGVEAYLMIPLTAAGNTGSASNFFELLNPCLSYLKNPQH
jgi:hypothetical protein